MRQRYSQELLRSVMLRLPRVTRRACKWAEQVIDFNTFVARCETLIALANLDRYDYKNLRRTLEKLWDCADINQESFLKENCSVAVAVFKLAMQIGVTCLRCLKFHESSEAEHQAHCSVQIYATTGRLGLKPEHYGFYTAKNGRVRCRVCTFKIPRGERIFDNAAHYALRHNAQTAAYMGCLDRCFPFARGGQVMKSRATLNEERTVECKTIVSGELKKKWKRELPKLKPISLMDYLGKLHMLVFDDYKKMWEYTDERRNEMMKRVDYLRQANGIILKSDAKKSITGTIARQNRAASGLSRGHSSMSVPVYYPQPHHAQFQMQQSPNI